jgi:Transglutaminase-like superfamily
MRKKAAILLLTMIVLMGLFGWYVVGGIQAYSRYQQSSIASQEHCGGQSPVHICVQSPLEIFSAYYPYYVATQSNVFVIHYSSSSPITLLMSVSIQGFSQEETHTVTATSSVQSISFRPIAMAQALRQLTVDTNSWLQVHITDTAKHVYYADDSPLLLRSRWLMQWIAANRLKIAAWVTPDDLSVIDLDKKAAVRLQAQPQPGPPAMIGYANGRASERAVIDQVDAIFDAMRLDYTIQYSQEGVPYNGPGDTRVSLQKIKLPAEVLQQHSGMCIELTVLLASAVERIGLHAEIVIIPGHAFLGVAVTPRNTKFEYWDPGQVSGNVAGDSANVWTDKEYLRDANQIVDTIVISDARYKGIGPML